MTIAFLGLGTMGAPMAERLIAAGFAPKLWNRSPGPLEAVLEKGGERLDGPAAAGSCDIVVTMLADDATVRAVLIDSGLLDAGKRGMIHVNMATVSVAFAVELAAAHAARGQAYVAAPVFGRHDVAAQGKLNIVAAGEAGLLDRVQPLLDAMGQKTWRVGEAPEQANVVKVAGNFMLANAIEVMAEASTLTRAYGVPAADFLDIMGNTLFAAPAYKGYGAMIAKQAFEPAGFKLKLGFKDVGLALSAAESRHVPLPIAGLLRDTFLDAIAQGDEGKDWSAISKVALRRAGLA